MRQREKPADFRAVKKRDPVEKRVKTAEQQERKLTLNKGFSCFWSAELKDVFNSFKTGRDLVASSKTTAITSCSGPPSGGGTPMAAVSRMLLSTLLHIRSISMELT